MQVRLCGGTKAGGCDPRGANKALRAFLILFHLVGAMSFKPDLRCWWEVGVSAGGSLFRPSLVLFEGCLDHAANDVFARVLAADRQHGLEVGFRALLGGYAVHGEAGLERGDRMQLSLLEAFQVLDQLGRVLLQNLPERGGVPALPGVGVKRQ